MKQSKSSRDWFFRIRDILTSIERIESYLGKTATLSAFKDDQILIDAVVRNFEIIGEAATAIPLSIQRSNPQVPWKQMVEMRNVLIHEYFGVDINTVWETARKHLPPLKIALEELLIHDQKQ